ncbi:MAG: cbb3-type cytochrome c oxidase subunit I [candidate division WOR-3 bacterium]|nr:cbb3-type cytochrome c oxidase subunit I [candidate division WOR-3 bacterium]MDW8150146.1 cbb3-type cytochrome c oxidase subunit I [candidate division WOR-3 bacterium]
MKIARSLKNLLFWELTIPIILLVLGIYHGLMQVLYRAGIIKSMEFLGINYYQGLTLHGVVNAIALTTFFAVAFGNAIIVYFLKREINLKVAWLSFWTMLIGTLLVAYAILIQKTDVLYTFYPPLVAPPAFYIGAVLLVVGSWIAFFNWIPTYLAYKKENKETPLAVYGILTTFLIWFLCTIPVAIEILFMLLPKSLGLVEEINNLLARTLFWMFGHALVYFWLLPIYVALYAMLPKIINSKLFSDTFARISFVLFIIFSIPVGVHHQYADPGIGTSWKLIQGFLTFAVAIPSFITAFTVSATLEYAGRKNGSNGLFGWLFKLPYFDKEKWLFAYFISGLFVFIIGGITGIVNASYNVNLVVHNTSYVPGHFHLTVGGLVFLGIIGITLYLISEITGKEVKFKTLNLLSPYLWLIGSIIFGFGMMGGGILGIPRRTHMGLTYSNPDSPLYNPDWMIWNHISVIGGVIMFISMVLYFIVFFATVFSKKEREEKLEIMDSEALEKTDNKVLHEFKLWIAIALILIVIAYTFVYYDVFRSTGG